ncbi:MAG: biopolymer transporter ExbD [Planctomycetaceae bacterium]|nr:biopolymer transporter ExbD [Planctomycetaceae bacterium]
MPLKTHPPEEPALNLTPMIDIVMLLVIFFMVGTQFTNAERQYEIDLPSVSIAQPLTALPDEIVVNVTREGSFYVQQEAVTIDQLKTILKEAHDHYADQAVVVRGDGAVNYQRIMDVLSLCQQVQITNVQLANQLAQEGGP